MSILLGMEVIVLCYFVGKYGIQLFRNALYGEVRNPKPCNCTLLGPYCVQVEVKFDFLQCVFQSCGPLSTSQLLDTL